MTEEQTRVHLRGRDAGLLHPRDGAPQRGIQGQVPHEVVAADETLGNRIRRAKGDKVPYVLVVGDDDVAHRTVGVNPRAREGERGEVERDVTLGSFVQRLAADVASKR
mgnify:CR=1 FL=1